MLAPARRVLLVENDGGSGARIAGVLGEHGFDVTSAASIAETQKLLEGETFACALLDVELADSAGLASVSAMRRLGPDLPVIVLSDGEDAFTPTKAIVAGAQDWVGKDEMTAGHLVHAIRLAIARHEAKAELARTASHDDLTGLAQRPVAIEHVRQALLRSINDTTTVAVPFCDLDRFKAVNDTHGHATGDEVLRVVARRLVKEVRPSDTVTRWSGDEFVIVVGPISDADQAHAISWRIRQSVARPVDIAGRRHQLSISVGTAFGVAASTPAELVALADQAMLDAKRQGRRALT